MLSERFRVPPEAFRSDEEFPRFVDVAPELGLNIVGLAGGAIAVYCPGTAKKFHNRKGSKAPCVIWSNLRLPVRS